MIWTSTGKFYIKQGFKVWYSGPRYTRFDHPYSYKTMYKRHSGLIKAPKELGVWSE